MLQHEHSIIRYFVWRIKCLFLLPVLYFVSLPIHFFPFLYLFHSVHFLNFLLALHVDFKLIWWKCSGGTFYRWGKFFNVFFEWRRSWNSFNTKGKGDRHRVWAIVSVWEPGASLEYLVFRSMVIGFGTIWDEVKGRMVRSWRIWITWQWTSKGLALLEGSSRRTRARVDNFLLTCQGASCWRIGNYA